MAAQPQEAAVTRERTTGRTRNGSGGPTKVWVSVDVKLSHDFNSVGFAFGFERTAPNESDQAVKRTELEMFELAEEIADKRIRKLSRVLRAAS